MKNTRTLFPLHGVIGIVDSARSQLDLARQFKLQCVEIRADLLNSAAGMSTADVLSVVSATKAAGLACLYTLRHSDQGGTFTGSENERVALCHQAIQAGADIIDLEFGTDSAAAMLNASAPMILSYHNFNAMLDAAQLAQLSAEMESLKPLAVKIIPTGQSLTDALTMMNWVRGAGTSVKRIGFSMGSDGAISRILALSCGSPITYASFGEPVAPGQVDIKLLLERYLCMNIAENSKISAVIGNASDVEQFYAKQNCAAHDNDAVAGEIYIPFASEAASAVEALRDEFSFNDIVYL